MARVLSGINPQTIATLSPDSLMQLPHSPSILFKISKLLCSIMKFFFIGLFTFHEVKNIPVIIIIMILVTAFQHFAIEKKKQIHVDDVFSSSESMNME